MRSSQILTQGDKTGCMECFMVLSKAISRCAPCALTLERTKCTIDLLSLTPLVPG